MHWLSDYIDLSVLRKYILMAKGKSGVVALGRQKQEDQDLRSSSAT